MYPLSPSPCPCSNGSILTHPSTGGDSTDDDEENDEGGGNEGQGMDSATAARFDEGKTTGAGNGECLNAPVNALYQCTLSSHFSIAPNPPTLANDTHKAPTNTPNQPTLTTYYLCFLTHSFISWLAGVSMDLRANFAAEMPGLGGPPGGTPGDSGRDASFDGSPSPAADATTTTTPPTVTNLFGWFG